MKYKTITFDANRPIPQQITEPLNSDYGVAVKVYKDGLLVDADLSVDGVACVEGFDGWKLAELSSGNVQTMKTIDVELDAPPTAREEISTENTYAATKMSDTSYRGRLTTVKNYLSAGTLPEQITVGTDNLDFTGKYRIIKEGQAGEWIPYGGTYWRIEHPMPEGGKRQYTKTNDNKWQSYVGGEILYYDTITLNTETDCITFAQNTNVTDTEPFDVDVVQTIVIDTRDGFNTKFQLQVQQKDLGYIEVVDNSAEPEPTPDPEESVEL